MSSKRKNSSISTSVKQHQITKFVEITSDQTRRISRTTSTKSALKEHCIKATVGPTIKGVNNKRARPDTISPESNHITNPQRNK